MHLDQIVKRDGVLCAFLCHRARLARKQQHSEQTAPQNGSSHRNSSCISLLHFLSMKCGGLLFPCAELWMMPRLLRYSKLAPQDASERKREHDGIPLRDVNFLQVLAMPLAALSFLQFR